MIQPTSGLDSTSTIIVLDVLRQVFIYPTQRIVDSQTAQVADGGCAVVFSIHQPSLKVHAWLDYQCAVTCASLRRSSSLIKSC